MMVKLNLFYRVAKILAQWHSTKPYQGNDPYNQAYMVLALAKNDQLIL